MNWIHEFFLDSPWLSCRQPVELYMVYMHFHVHVHTLLTADPTNIATHYLWIAHVPTVQVGGVP